jgi:putative ABC transport system permease protein
LRGFASLDPGWKVDGLTIGYLTLPESKYPNGNALRTFNDRLQETLAALPGVESATLCWTMPVTQFNVAGSFEIEGRPESEKGHSPVRFLNGVTPPYFGTLGMKFLEGRNFVPTDTTNHTPVVIINEKMARNFWPNESPIGKRVEGEEIVGVVTNVRFPANPAELKTPFQTYRPLAQEPRTRLVIAVRGNLSGDILRRAVAQLDPDQPVSDAGPASARVGSSLDNWAVGSRLLTCFALLGLSLAALGIYGVISGFVAQRTAEIGVRMALGARMQNVLWLVLGKGLRLSLFGTLIGLLGAFGLVRILGSVMPALPASDPRVILFVATLLLSVTFFACWLPARRAARVDPIVALRNE